MASAPDLARLAGGCQCGAVRYAIAGAPLALYVCHCRECQKQSASAFGISLIVRRADFHLDQGTVGRWSRETDSGRRLTCVFCPTCGSRLWHEPATRQSRSASRAARSTHRPTSAPRSTSGPPASSRAC